MKWLKAVLAMLTLISLNGAAQNPASPKKTILAVGAHAGDMEITAGALIAKQVKAGDRAVFLHLTLGEGGNPKLTPEKYGEQKRREAVAAAQAIGAEVLFGPYKDGELPNSEESRRYVSDVMRQVKPTHLITHWKNSLHKDHSTAYSVVTDATLMASLPGVKSAYPAHGGLRSILFAENWEDKPDFQPYVYVDVTDAAQEWEKCVTQYEFIRGGISRYPYLEYYRALLKVRGADAGFGMAESFDIDPYGKKQVYRSLP
jgi:N-acetylglucosamine malate deacetylase 1